MSKINSQTVMQFIAENLVPYEGTADFLQPATERTQKLWQQVENLLQQEQQRGGVLAVEEKIISGITAFPPGFIDQELELIKGLQ